MPIRKKDRSFQNIVREVDIDRIPVEYVQTLTLVLANNDRIIFEGEDLKEVDEDHIVAFLVSVAEDISDEYGSPIEDIEIVVNYSRLENEISSMTKQLLKGSDDTSDSSM